MPTHHLPRVISIMGPTAAGKTDLAIALAEQLNGQLISVDSVLIYCGMDIGTAKPSTEELARAPHKLISFLDPAETYNAADFCHDATREIEHALAVGRTPILVGGTMMYFKALLEGLSQVPKADLAVREKIEQLAQEKGWPEVHRKLAECDPESAQAIHPNHSQRLSRALEVAMSTGKPMSYWQGNKHGGLIDRYDWVQLAIAPRDRKTLHARIAKRLENMMANGFIEEVKDLHHRGDLHTDLPSIRAVGYRQVWAHLSGEYDYDEAIEKAKAATRQLAKRQLTWLRNWKNLEWIYTESELGEPLTQSDILAAANQLLK